MQRGLVVGGLAMAFVAACEEPFHQKDFYFVDFQQDQHPTARIAEGPRPSTCPDMMQPAIVDFEGPAHTPVWACISACKRAQEPVTFAMALADPHASTQLSARCEPICPPSTHRHSYIELDSHPFEQRCDPGAPPDSQRAEEEHIRTVLEAQQGQSYDAIDEQLHELARRPARWDDATIAMYLRIDNEIREFEQRFEDHPASTKLHTELKRIEGLREQLSKAERAQARAQQRAELAHEHAQQNCNYLRDECLATCTKISGSMCAQCRSDYETCSAGARAER